MNLDSLIEKVNKRREDFGISSYPILSHITGEYVEMATGEWKKGVSRYLAWLTAICEELKPKQVVELGAYVGLSTCMLLAGMPIKSKLITVDIKKDSWSVLPKDSRVVKVVGNDLDLSIYPKRVDLSKTDLWFIDSDHTGEQLRREVDLYSPFWKKGTVVLLDDVHYPEFPSYAAVWHTLPYKKRELPELHQTGFGIMKI